MKKIVLSVISLFSLIAPAVLVPPVATHACPVKAPETLLSLYRNSETIHIGRYVREERGEPTKKEDNENYTIVEVRRHFDVSSTLKGNAAKTVTLFDDDWIYTPRPAGFDTIEEVEAANRIPEVVDEDEEATPEVEVEDEDAAGNELEPGDHVLLFLRRAEEGDRMQLVDYRDGLKDLPPADLAVYEARINELAPILAAEKTAVDKIVDWLIRCAEDPVTRWEGVYEIERSFEALRYKNEREAERKEKIANGETPEEEDYFDEGLDTGRTTIFATSLNEFHKQTLINILLNSEFQPVPGKRGRAASVRGDRELLALVSRWGSARIAELLINRLRGGSYSPLENSDMMAGIASYVDDERVSGIAEEYRDIYYKSDNDEVEKSDREDDEVDDTSETAVEPDASKPVTEPAVEISDEVAAEKLETPAPARKAVLTYAQLRAELLSKFLVRVDEVLAEPAGRVPAGK